MYLTLLYPQLSIICVKLAKRIFFRIDDVLYAVSGDKTRVGSQGGPRRNGGIIEDFRLEINTAELEKLQNYRS